MADALTREGVPYETVITGAAGVITDAKLADYGANRAKYQAVVLAFGNLEDVLPAADKAALDKFQKTFGIRQLSDQTFPNAAHGLNAATQSGSQDGVLGTLTATGKLAFPYLKGEVPIANDDPSPRKPSATLRRRWPARTSRRSSQDPATPRSSASTRTPRAARRW